MDGLTVSRANKFLKTGDTFSEIRQQDLKQGVSTKNDLGKSFSDTLKDAVKDVDHLQKQADVMMKKLSTGEAKNLPEVLIAAEKADIAFKLLVQVRNKIIDAYQEVMKMQV